MKPFVINRLQCLFIKLLNIWTLSPAYFKQSDRLLIDNEDGEHGIELKEIIPTVKWVISRLSRVLADCWRLVVVVWGTAIAADRGCDPFVFSIESPIKGTPLFLSRTFKCQYTKENILFYTSQVKPNILYWLISDVFTLACPGDLSSPVGHLQQEHHRYGSLL